MSNKNCIVDRLSEMELEGAHLVDRMQRLKALYHQGYRYVDDEDNPCLDADNVVNIESARK